MTVERAGHGAQNGNPGPQQGRSERSRLALIEVISLSVLYPHTGGFPPPEPQNQIYMAMEKDSGFLTALEEAKVGFSEGGVPIGACLVSKHGKILGRGHNMRVQKGSATLHV